MLAVIFLEGVYDVLNFGKRIGAVPLILLVLLGISGLTMTVKAADNTSPTLTVSSPKITDVYSELPGYNLLTISGTVADANDGDKAYIRYSVNGGEVQSLALGNKDGTDPGGDYLLTHVVSRSFAGTVDVKDWTEGVKTIHVWAVDDQGGLSAEKIVSVVMDRTYPLIRSVLIVRDPTYLSLNPSVTETNLDPLPYRYIKKGSTDFVMRDWTAGLGRDYDVVPNQRYWYDVEVKDKAGHVTRMNVQGSTLALDPAVQVLETGDNFITLGVIHDARNAVPPEVQLMAKEYGAKPGDAYVKASSFSTSSVVTLTGLSPNHRYSVWVMTRNVDFYSDTLNAHHQLLESVWTNRPPAVTISPLADNRFSEVTGRRTITLSGKAFDQDGNTLLVSAAINGVSKVMTIGKAPTSLPTTDNWSLSWDVVDDGLSEGSYSISVTVDDQQR